MINTPLPKRFCVALFVAATLATGPALAARPTPPAHWVGSWGTADLERPNTNGAFGAADTTLRQIVHLSLGGSMVRVELSNAFGTEPLTIGAAQVALSAGMGDLTTAGGAPLMFSGHPSIIIPPGAEVVSDPVAITATAFADLAISLFLPAQKMAHLTVHNSAYQTNFIAPGNVTADKSLPTGDTGAKKTQSWFFLKAVDVSAAANAGSVVAFGDSITDGTFSTPDKNSRWPDLFAKRLSADKSTASLGVLNMGIGGNRVLHDNTGQSALARFDRDVLAQAGVKYVILLESINDIGHASDPVKPYDVVGADDLIAGFTQMIERAHMHGIKVIGATLTPYTGAKYMSPAGELIRKAVNDWIRTSKSLDGVIDFDAATVDKASGAFNPAYDHGDHLHPNDAGMKAMADSIDLKLFTEK